MESKMDKETFTLMAIISSAESGLMMFLMEVPYWSTSKNKSSRSSNGVSESRMPPLNLN
jgi:hypothetical protein